MENKPPSDASSAHSSRKKAMTNMPPSNPPENSIPDAAVHSSPPLRCFAYSKKLPFRSALTMLLQFRDPPEDRTDLNIPDDDDIAVTLEKVELHYKDVLTRPNAKKLIHDCGLTPDEVKAIICFTIDRPCEVYRWLNAWLVSNERWDYKEVTHVGPFFLLLYRGMKKLPRLKVRASRGVSVRDIKELRKTFDDYENRCKKGSFLNFWGIASFSTNDVVTECFAEDDDDDAIVYTCGDLECVSTRDFSICPGDDEVVPLPPTTFEVQGAIKLGKRLVIAIDQKDPSDIAYVEPKVPQ